MRRRADKHVDYAPFRTRFPKLTAEIAKTIQYDGQLEEDGHIYLYDDESIPDSSEANWRAYRERLATLAKPSVTTDGADLETPDALYPQRVFWRGWFNTSEKLLARGAEESSIGDLARDAADDETFPLRASAQEIARYSASRTASQEVCEAFTAFCREIKEPLTPEQRADLGVED